MPEEGETEHFEDPDFASEWDAVEEEDSDSQLVEENSSESEFETLGDEDIDGTDLPMKDDSDDWKEV